MSLKKFLIKLALSKYNEQYGLNVNPDLCDVRSIPKRQRHDLSYEIRTNREDDYLKLNIHLNFGDGDALRPYRIETEGAGRGNLLDEVFVATGVIDSHYRDKSIYKFHTLEYSDYLLEILLLEDDAPLLLEDETHLLLE